MVTNIKNFKLIQKWSDSQGNELTDGNALGDDKQKIEMEAGDSLTRTITMTASNNAAPATKLVIPT